MPLDLTPWTETETSPELQIIDKMIERLSDPKNWCKGALSATRACILYTYWQIDRSHHGIDDGPVADALRASTKKLFPQRMSDPKKMMPVGGFNDHPDTTHADIMSVLHRAREIIKHSTG